MKRALFIILTALVGIAGGLGIAELGLRIVGFEFKLYPEKVQFGWPDPTQLESRYQVDPELLWMPQDYAQRLASARAAQARIVFMGDSCTEFGSYPAELEHLIARRYPQNSYAAANLAVAGWSSYQGLRQFERDILPLAPRVVSIFFGWNDHWDTFGIEDKDIGRFHRYHAPGAALQRSRVKQLWDTIAFRRFQERETNSASSRVSEADFRANLREIVILAREHGIVPVLLTAPSAHERGREPPYLAERHLARIEQLVPLHRRYVEIVREIAEELDVALVDLERAFSQGEHRVRRGEYFLADGIHFTRDGDVEVARLIYARLEQLGLMEGLVAD